MSKTAKAEIVAYDVYDKNNKWMTGYSLELSKLNICSDALDMAKQTVKHHVGGYIAARYSDGSLVKMYCD